MSFQPHFIQIDAGTIKSAELTDAAGTRPDYSSIGDFVFFIDLVEHDGGRLGLWSGRSYEQAIREAESARADFGIAEAVHDLVAGGAE